MGQPFEECVSLPEELLNDYIQASGFVNIVLQDNMVIKVEKNLEAWESGYSTPPTSTIQTPSEIDKLRADIDFIAAMTGVEL